jgi:hypothetical protein
MDGVSNSRKALQKRLRAETPSGNWPTPTCADTRTDKLKSTQQTPGSMHSVSLAQAAQMWPTPDANMGARGTQSDWQPTRKSGHPAQYSINQAVRDLPMKMWGTPKAQDSRHATWDRGKCNLGEQVSGLHDGGSLNPTWTEWLMGWPLEWTDLKPLATDKFLCVQQQHLNCLEIA